jgi:hypothetical protein
VIFIIVKLTFSIKELTTPLITKGIDGWLIPPYKTTYNSTVIFPSPSLDRFLGCKSGCINIIKDSYNFYTQKVITFEKLHTLKGVYFLLLDIKLDCCKKNHWVILKSVSKKDVIVYDPLYGDVIIGFDKLKKIWDGKVITTGLKEN